jgi:hypothetical protein
LLVSVAVVVAVRQVWPLMGKGLRAVVLAVRLVKQIQVVVAVETSPVKATARPVVLESSSLDTRGSKRNGTLRTTR